MQCNAMPQKKQAIDNAVSLTKLLCVVESWSRDCHSVTAGPYGSRDNNVI